MTLSYAMPNPPTRNPPAFPSQSTSYSMVVTNVSVSHPPIPRSHPTIDYVLPATLEAQRGTQLSTRVYRKYIGGIQVPVSSPVRLFIQSTDHTTSLCLECAHVSTHIDFSLKHTVPLVPNHANIPLHACCADSWLKNICAYDRNSSTIRNLLTVPTIALIWHEIKIRNLS
jgi:hypothetical protein